MGQDLRELLELRKKKKRKKARQDRRSFLQMDDRSQPSWQPQEHKYSIYDKETLRFH